MGEWRSALLLIGAGVAVGVPAAMSAARLIANQLFEVSPSAPTVLAASVILLLLVSLLAGFVPARRAARVDPAIVLRAE